MRTNSRWMRHFALCMVIVMAFSLLPGTGALVASAAGKTANISSASGLTAEAGGTITVPVNISDYSGIAGMGLMVTYDKDVLTPVSVEATGLTEQGVLDDSIGVAAGNSFKIVWAQGESENITAEGTLFNITFSVSEYAGGETSIEFAGVKRDTFDEDFDQVALNCTPAAVTVTPKANTQTTLRSAAGLNANSGSEIDIPVYLDNPNGIQAFSFNVKWDPKAFSYDSYAGGIAPSNGISMNGSTDRLQLDVSGIPESASSGLLMVLKFKTKEYAGGNFIFELSSDDVDTQDFRVKVVNTHANENAVISGGDPVIDEDTLIVPVRISNNHGVAGFRIKMNYDQNVLAPVSVSKSEMLKGNFNNSISGAQGSFDLLWTGTDNITDDGELFAVTFNIIDHEAETTTIGLDYTQGDTCDENLDPVIFTMQDIEVTFVPPVILESIDAVKTKTAYVEGDTLNVDDIILTANYSDGTSREVTGFTTNASEIDMSTAGSKTLVITYTEGKVTKTAEVEITVGAVLDHISAVKAKTEYFVGETINIDDLIVTAHYSDGTSREVTTYLTNVADLSTASICECALFIFYSENNDTKNTFVHLSVIRALQSITVTKNKTDYHVGDELTTDDLEVTAHYNNDTEYEAAGFTTNKDDIDMSTAGIKILTVSYTEKGRTATSSVAINVTAVLTGITAGNVRTEYDLGDKLELGNMIVTASYNDGTSREVTGFTTNAEDIDMSSEGEKTLTVSYTEDGVTKETTIKISVSVPAVLLSSLKADKAKTDYKVGDELNVDDLTVTAVYEDGTEKEVTGYTTNAEDIDMSSAGSKTLTVSYTEEGVTRTASVTIKVAAVLTSISASKTRLDYDTDDVLNIDDIIVTASYNDGTSKEVLGFTTNAEDIDMSTEGEKTLTVSYTEDGVTKTADIVLSVTAASIPEEPVLRSITVEKTKTDYHVGDDVDTSDITVTAVYSDDSSKQVTGFTTNAQEINMNTAGNKTLTVSYTEGDKTATSSVILNVTAVLSSINAVKVKTEYNTGDVLDDSDIIVTASYNDGTSQDVTGFTTNAEDIDMSSEGEKTLTVSYTEDGVTKETTIEITVTKVDVPAQPVLEYIEAEKEKTTYYVGEELTTSDITVTAFYNDGSSRTVTGFSARIINGAENKRIVIRYGENGVIATATIIITVRNVDLTSIAATKVKNDYEVGDTLNTDDIIVTASYSNDTSKIVTGFTTNAEDIDMSKAGEKTLTVSYTEGSVTKTADLTITVRAVLDHITVEKEKTEYIVGDELDISDLTVTAFYNDESSRKVTGYTTNASSVDMSTEGSKTLIVSYSENGRTATSSAVLTVKAAPQVQLKSIKAVKKKTVYYEYDTMNFDDLTVTAEYSDGSSKTVTGYTTNEDDLWSFNAGKLDLIITYTEGDVTVTTKVVITVKALTYFEDCVVTMSGIGNMTYTDSLWKSATYFDKKVIVKLNGKKLTLNKDYWVFSENIYNVGKARITVYGMGAYSGSKSKTIKINPKGTKLSKLKAGKKAITVKWKKQSKKMSKSRITGYQIRYSLKSSMKKSKKVTVKGYKKTSKTIKKLKAKKKYYVQIRTYKTVKGKKYYSKWSAKKAIKTKK